MTKPTRELTYWPNGNIEYEEYLVNDKCHRTDGPARVWYYENGSIEYEEYWVDGKRHRTDGPAFIRYGENGNIEREEYWVDGKCHRTDGPARIKYYENGNIELEAYRVDGEALTKEEFKSRNYPKINQKTTSNKCECGAHSIGSRFHSTWCPLYNKR